MNSLFQMSCRHKTVTSCSLWLVLTFLTFLCLRRLIHYVSRNDFQWKAVRGFLRVHYEAITRKEVVSQQKQKSYSTFNKKFWKKLMAPTFCLVRLAQTINIQLSNPLTCTIFSTTSNLPDIN